MDLNDLEPKKAKSHELGQDLSKHSVAELQALIATLKRRDRQGGAGAHRQAIVEERRGSRVQTLTIF